MYEGQDAKELRHGLGFGNEERRGAIAMSPDSVGEVLFYCCFGGGIFVI